MDRLDMNQATKEQLIKAKDQNENVFGFAILIHKYSINNIKKSELRQESFEWPRN